MLGLLATSPTHDLDALARVTYHTYHFSADSHTLLEQIQVLACSINMESSSVEGESWLTGALIDFVSFHFAQHFPDVHFLPTNFAAFDLPNAVKRPETLKVCCCLLLDYVIHSIVCVYLGYFDSNVLVLECRGSRNSCRHQSMLASFAQLFKVVLLLLRF